MQIVDVDAGHWIMQEKRDETNRILEEFFENGVDGAKANHAGLRL